VPSLPALFWYKRRSAVGTGFNKTCAHFPSLNDLHYNNQHWQLLNAVNDSEFYLFGAYYDDRPLVTGDGKSPAVVRILAMINRLSPPPTYCQFWIDSSRKPVFSPVASYTYLWIKAWGNGKDKILQPFLITCKIPRLRKEDIPVSVSLVERPCNNATNHLKIQYNIPKQKNRFAVCVKGLNYLEEDISVKLIEWFELLHMLGADKVFMYEFAVHPNVSKVLQYYNKLGWIDVRQITYPGKQVNFPEFLKMYQKARITYKRQNEVIPYNDCLYRNLHSYDYLALLDTDEVIMPTDKHVASWGQLMDSILPKTKDSHSAYCAQNVYFFHDALAKHGGFPDVPPYMHMLQHVYRSRNYTKPGSYVKCMHRVGTVLHLHNHFPLGCLQAAGSGSGNCKTYSMDKSDAQLQHYRKDCEVALKNCSQNYKENPVLDDSIWKFKKQLITRSKIVLKELGFLKKHHKVRKYRNITGV